MNRSQVIEALAKQEHLTFKTAEDVVDTFFTGMEKSLTNGNRIEIRGLGSFMIKHYEGYTGRNPRTGEATEVASKRMPFFRPGNELKDRVDTRE